MSSKVDGVSIRLKSVRSMTSSGLPAAVSDLGDAPVVAGNLVR